MLFLSAIWAEEPYCYTHYCSTEFSLPELSELYESLDFREAGLSVSVPRNQNFSGCRSGWAFALAAASEMLVLRQRPQNEPWKSVDASELRISPQFIMDNDFGYSHYCVSGSAFISANYLQMTGLTVETDGNFPYDSEARKADWERRASLDDSDPGKFIKPKLGEA